MPSQEDLESLYVVNKKAKQYSNQSHVYEYRSDALYRLKHEALSRWGHQSEKIEKHYIENKAYVFFSFTGPWSFHVPSEIIDIDTQFEDTKVLHNFSPSQFSEKSNLVEKQALRHLYDEFRLNANSFLPKSTETQQWAFLPIRHDIRL